MYNFNIRKIWKEERTLKGFSLKHQREAKRRKESYSLQLWKILHIKTKMKGKIKEIWILYQLGPGRLNLWCALYISILQSGLRGNWISPLFAGAASTCFYTVCDLIAKQKELFKQKGRLTKCHPFLLFVAVLALSGCNSHARHTFIWNSFAIILSGQQNVT